MTQLGEIAKALSTNEPLPHMNTRLTKVSMDVKLYSKGRPRMTKGGKAFTPKNTRLFEAKVARHFKLHLQRCKGKLLYCPVKVVLTLRDPRSKSMPRNDFVLATNELLYSVNGDVDNRAKSILDAANGIIYCDDCQISDLRVHRRYSAVEGFDMSVHRSGLSRAEATNIGKWL
jgi:Holliday junction resolvase RusA-like endonuclease